MEHPSVIWEKQGGSMRLFIPGGYLGMSIRTKNGFHKHVSFPREWKSTPWSWLVFWTCVAMPS